VQLSQGISSAPATTVGQKATPHDSVGAGKKSVSGPHPAAVIAAEKPLGPGSQMRRIEFM
jgi:hypothetical protein